MSSEITFYWDVIGKRDTWGRNAFIQRGIQFFGRRKRPFWRYYFVVGSCGSWVVTTLSVGWFSLFDIYIWGGKISILNVAIFCYIKPFNDTVWCFEGDDAYLFLVTIVMISVHLCLNLKGHWDSIWMLIIPSSSFHHLIFA